MAKKLSILALSYLNVWTADGYAGRKRAVMVFIHGGSYGWGGTSDPLYDGRNFVKAHPEIILVTIAYRVGIFGFMDFSEVPGGEEYPNSGNLGLLDQVCALRYIRENIAAFGGDPRNVTVFGESAGGGSVSLLTIIPEAKGLFSKIIAESGSVALTYGRNECKKLTRMLLRETGAKSMDELSMLSEDILKKANRKLNPYNNFPERDGIVLPEDPYGAYERGEAFPVSMMIGTNEDELRYWILDLESELRYRLMSEVMLKNVLRCVGEEDKKRVRAFLAKQPGCLLDRPWKITELFNELLFRLPAIRQAEAHAAKGNLVYMYYWKYPSSIQNLGACHAVELAYVFGNLTETIYAGEGISQPLAERVQAMWANFALTDNPSLKELEWKPFSAESGNTMLIDNPCCMASGFRTEDRQLLFPLLNHYFNGNLEREEIERRSSRPYLVLSAAAVGLAAAFMLLGRSKDPRRPC